MTHDDSRPRLATLDDEGWTLDDAEARFATGAGVYWLPSRWEREHLEEHVQEDGCVKLIFRIRDETNPTEPAIERMWVTLDSREGELYHGHLANDPVTKGRATDGMAVWFGAQHVIDYEGGPHGRASADKDLLKCATHGPSATCYVCAHLTQSKAPLGFNTASDSIDPRPDAWCNACDKLLEGKDSWDDVGAQQPEIKIVCGGCYDSLAKLHSRPGAL